LLEHALNNLGSKLNRKNFKFQPWARGYRLTLNNNNTMLFSTTRTPQREELFKWVGPIYKARIGLIAKKSSNININTVEEIRGYNIGAVLDDVAEQLLYSKKIRRNTIDSISGKNVIKQSFKKLEHNRIDLFSYNTDVAFYSLSDQDKKKFEVVHVLDELELYFAFNKQTDDKLISLLQEELNRIKKTPVYKEILQRYIN
jgi:polar amino acid transport system substrate-binding protein